MSLLEGDTSVWEVPRFDPDLQLDEWHVAPDVEVIAEVVVGAPPSPPRPPCEHRSEFREQVKVAIVESADGGVDHWEVKLVLRCALCHEPFAIVPETARRPRDGGPGTVFVLRPPS